MKIIVNKYLVPKGFIAWALYPFIIFRDSKYMSSRKRNHEKIHIAQQKELWVIGFYILYAFSYLQNLVRRDLAPYKNIVFEREAYSNERNIMYLAKRKKHSWRKYWK